MKAARIYLTTLLLFAATAVCSAQAGTPPYKYYDYITIVVWGETPNMMYISYNGFSYKKIKISDKVKGDFDFNMAINLVNEYEQDGYELYANNFIPHAYVNPGTNYFLLRREHKDKDKEKDKVKEKVAARSATE